MLSTAGVGPDEKVQDMATRMRCRECDEKGRAVMRSAGSINDAGHGTDHRSPGSPVVCAIPISGSAKQRVEMTKVFHIRAAGLAVELDLSPFHDFDAAWPYIEGYLSRNPLGEVQVEEVANKPTITVYRLCPGNFILQNQGVILLIPRLSWQPGIP
jgi:hypothetical protein